MPQRSSLRFAGWAGVVSLLLDVTDQLRQLVSPCSRHVTFHVSAVEKTSGMLTSLTFDLLSCPLCSLLCLSHKFSILSDFLDHTRNPIATEVIGEFTVWICIRNVAKSLAEDLQNWRTYPITPSVDRTSPSLRFWSWLTMWIRWKM